MHLFDTDPLTRGWAFALVSLIAIVITIPVIRLLAALCIHGYATITGQRHLHAVARRVMPRIAHLIGSIVIGTASLAAPAMAQGQAQGHIPSGVATIDLDRAARVQEPSPDGAAIDLDRGTSLQQHEPPVPATEATQEAAPMLYVVRAGDSLWSIAQDHLEQPTDAATTAAWKAIWRANRTVVGDHPEHITPGAVLTLGELA